MLEPAGVGTEALANPLRANEAETGAWHCSVDSVGVVCSGAFDPGGRVRCWDTARHCSSGGVAGIAVVVPVVGHGYAVVVALKRPFWGPQKIPCYVEMARAVRSGEPAAVDSLLQGAG
jgi:hypothetical protein